VKKWVSMIFGLFLLTSACASNDDDHGGGTGDGGGSGDGSPFADARPSADARPFSDARPPGDGGTFPFPDGGFDFGDGGFGCTTDDDCEDTECCAEVIPGFKVCIDKAEDAGPGECTFTF
jgi:hypothetical protein